VPGTRGSLTPLRFDRSLTAVRPVFLAAATALMRNSGRLLSLSKDNSLLRFLQEGLPSSIVVAQRDSRKVSVTWAGVCRGRLFVRT